MLHPFSRGSVYEKVSPPDLFIVHVCWITAAADAAVLQTGLPNLVQQFHGAEKRGGGMYHTVTSPTPHSRDLR